jgi:hypothetical protein
MKKIKELKMPDNDAVNYTRSEDKEFFNNIFVIDETLDNICSSGKYFLIGEKGSGKTAYSVYLSNQEYKNTYSNRKSISDTDYKKFIQMRMNKHLALSDYNSIWKVLLFILIAKEINRCIDTSNPLKKHVDYKNITKAIDEYYLNAFSPEIIQAFEFIENIRESNKIIAKYCESGSEETRSERHTKSKFQTELFYLQHKFEKVFESIKLKKNYILFIDGIDTIPTGIDKSDYMDCIKGLSLAIWELNMEYFAKVKDANIKVILLVRPEIMVKLGLQNTNNKIRDNSILLEWGTKYADYRTSKLFKVVDNILSKQQNVGFSCGDAWDYYFPYKIYNFETKDKSDNPFIDFLRHSFYRPRDMIDLIKGVQYTALQKDKEKSYFDKDDFENSLHNYSNYLLGEIKDQLQFEYTDQDYESFLQFFQYLNGRKHFSYTQFLDSYRKFIIYLKDNSIHIPRFFETAETFLQFLYELNIICYIEKSEQLDSDFQRWCFRERHYANLNPKVKTNVDYNIHNGIARSLNIGRKILKNTS